MCHLYLLITTKERSVHDSFMPDKYLSRQQPQSVHGNQSPTDESSPYLLPFVSRGKTGGGYRYSLNLSNSNIHKSLIRSQCCNQHSQQQQGSCRINPLSLLVSAWLPIGSGRLQWDGQSRENTGSCGLL